MYVHVFTQHILCADIGLNEDCSAEGQDGTLTEEKVLEED